MLQSGTGSYMDTEPGVAFLIGREGRDCHVIDKGLVRGQRAAQAAKLGWYRVEISPPLANKLWGGFLF